MRIKHFRSVFLFYFCFYFFYQFLGVKRPSLSQLRSSTRARFFHARDFFIRAYLIFYTHTVCLINAWRLLWMLTRHHTVFGLFRLVLFSFIENLFAYTLSLITSNFSFVLSWNLSNSFLFVFDKASICIFSWIGNSLWGVKSSVWFFYRNSKSNLSAKIYTCFNKNVSADCFN